MHGYGIASWIETATDEVLRVEEGSLYPALYRMVQKRWIKGDWGASENNRRAKFYHLTTAGRARVRRAGDRLAPPLGRGEPGRHRTQLQRGAQR